MFWVCEWVSRGGVGEWINAQSEGLDCRKRNPGLRNDSTRRIKTIGRRAQVLDWGTLSLWISPKAGHISVSVHLWGKDREPVAVLGSSEVSVAPTCWQVADLNRWNRQAPLRGHDQVTSEENVTKKKVRAGGDTESCKDLRWRCAPGQELPEWRRCGCFLVNSSCIKKRGDFATCSEVWAERAAQVPWVLQTHPAEMSPGTHWVFLASNSALPDSSHALFYPILDCENSILLKSIVF